MRISAIASCARRRGRKPFEHGWKSASKIGSNTSFTDACTTRSATTGIPSLRRLFVPGFGIIRSRTGRGWNVRALSWPRRSSRNASAPRRRSMSRTVCPSTPDERAPVLPLTRCHATARNAGSATRLYRSSNRRVASALAHRCSLVWISSTRAWACCRPGHGASVFTGDLLAFHSHVCGLAACLRHVPGSPRLGLLRRLRPLCQRQPTVGLPAPGLAGRGEGAGRRFPCSPCPGRRGRCPALPLQPRHGYAAGFRRGLHSRHRKPLVESTTSCVQVVAHCRPAHIHQVWSRFHA